MARTKEVTYLVKVQSEYNKNSWQTYCETKSLQLAESIAENLRVPVHIAKKTVETTFELILEKN